MKNSLTFHLPIMQIFKKPFSALTASELYSLLQVRAEVFVVEQQIIYQDMDNDDQSAVHVWITEADKVVAYARVCALGTHMKEVSIGRVLTIDRGKGYGVKVVEACLQVAQEYFHVTRVDIEAQEYAKGFYERLGFRQTTEPFVLEDIVHVGMRWESIHKNPSCKTKSEEK